MFVSRSFGRDRGGSGESATRSDDVSRMPFIVVEEPHPRSSEHLDKGVIPAILAWIIQDLTALHQSAQTVDKPAGVNPIGIAAVRPVSAYTESMPPHSIIYDGFCGNQSSTVQRRIDAWNPSGFDNLLSTLDSHADDSGANGILFVIDSLTSYARLGLDLTAFAAGLERWRASQRVLAILSTVLVWPGLAADEQIVSDALKSMANTRVTVSQSALTPRPVGLEDGLESATRKLGMPASTCVVDVGITRLLPSGRVNIEHVKATYNHITHSLVVASVQERKYDSHTLRQNSSVAEETAAREKMERLGLTFNLGLTDQERAARDGVCLPYVHQSKEIADTGLDLHPKYLSTDRTKDVDSTDGYYSPDEYDEEYEESEDV
jgi:Elongator subunit Iki1